MRSDELVAGGDLAAEGVAGLTGQIRELHGGIAERVFWAVGLGGLPVKSVQAVHDEVAEAAYGTARMLSAGALRVGVRAAGALRGEEQRSIEESRRGRFAVGAVNGAFGDALVKRGNALAIPMTVRVHGRAVPPEAEELSRAFPAATPRLAVFMHGLCETEDAWRLHADRHAPYGHRLATELGYTPVYVRYNTGRHISDNGRQLAGLLEQLVGAWPVEVAEIALIGHSMGGLVARSACHYGAGSDAIKRVRHVFALGAPHHGAQLERFAHAAGAALGRLTETRALAGALRARSVGIRDLYHGYLVDEDWADYDPEAFLVAAAREIPFLSTADHYFVAATLTREADAPVGRMLGDLLVSRASAWAHRRPTERMRFPVDKYRHIGGANHLDLLNHPAIGEQLVRWLGDRRALSAPAEPVGQRP